jgi:hypothetical protein
MYVYSTIMSQMLVKWPSINFSVILTFAFINWQDPEKKQFAEELLVYTDAFSKAAYSSITSKGDVSEETGKRAELVLVNRLII